MLKHATPKTESSSPGGHEVFRVRVSDGALSLIEVNAGDARSVYRNWLASLDEKAARLIAGKPSADVARRVVEVAETYLQANDIERAVRVLELVASSEQFVGTQEHTLAVAALKNLRP